MLSSFTSNDSGWIVGWATKSQGSGQGNRAVLLVPIHDGCSADVNGDCFVDGVDLGFVLGQWSIPETAPGCEGEVPCHGDINCDGFVNGLDLGIVLAQWTGRDPCNENCGLGFESFSSSMSTQGISSYEEQLIETLIEMGLDDFAQQLEELLGLQ